jgi:hypothetical protein
MMVASIICSVASHTPLPASASRITSQMLLSAQSELPENRIPVAEFFRQIAPRRAGSHEDRIEPRR